jgi:hypothetical protein
LFIWLRRTRQAKAFLGSFACQFLLFISFAPPKEMNQRKRGRKCQPQPFWAPATQSHIGATKKAAVRAISGIAPRLYLLVVQFLVK